MRSNLVRIDRGSRSTPARFFFDGPPLRLTCYRRPPRLPFAPAFPRAEEGRAFVERRRIREAPLVEGGRGQSRHELELDRLVFGFLRSFFGSQWLRYTRRAGVRGELAILFMRLPSQTFCGPLKAPAGTIVNSNDVPLLSFSEVAERLDAFQASGARNQNYMAMYSSIFGGITTDPSAMVIPIDDHMVHRGHGVFDTAAIMDGHLYELEQHLDRFLKSALMAKIPLPFDRSAIRSVLIQTVSASKCTQGSLRYWLSVGPGDFQLSSSGCTNPALYAVVIESPSLPVPAGCKVITSSIPVKSPQFAVMKNVNYLPNALTKVDGEENGGFTGIWLDDEGFVAEGSNMNVGFVTRSKELLMPRFNKILSGCTAKRVLTLAEQLVADGRLSGITSRNVSVQEGKAADEMMLIGSGILVKPVVQWDDQVIGSGKEGPVAQALFDLILEDMRSGPSSVRIPVPY